MDKTIKQYIFPPNGGEVMVEMLFDCIIFLTVPYIHIWI